jgi:hypothetical protein
VWHQHEEV